MEVAAQTIGRPSAFAGVRKTHLHNRHIPEKAVKDFLHTTDEYTKYRRTAPIKYNRGTWAHGIRQHGEMDIGESRKLAKYNRRYPYVLCLIDCFSKRLWTEPMRTKTAAETARALERILEESGNFKRIASDEGTACSRARRQRRTLFIVSFLSLSRHRV